MKKILKEKLIKSSLTKRTKQEVLETLKIEEEIKDDVYIKIMNELRI